MARCNIADFVVGQKYGGVYICKSHVMKVSKTGGKYIDMQIIDKTGEINGKCWSIPQGFNPDKIVDGDFIALVLNIEEYQGKPQAKIDNIRLILPTDEFDKSEVIPVAPEPAESMYNEIIDTIQEMNNKDIQKLCFSLYTENENLIMRCPAAKIMHHAVVSGLLQHITGMLRLGKAICSVYPMVNRDVLLGGIILHDICKLREFVLGPVGLCIDYTKEGKMIGHISMGAMYIEKKCEELKINDELKLMLTHMILSHHGQPEFGSPVKPQTMEAILLNLIDNIDAKIYMCNDALDKINPGEFTEKIYGIDNVSLYKPLFGLNEIDNY